MYHIRLNSDGTYDIEAPDGTPLSESNDGPPDMNDPALWETMAEDAIANNRWGHLMATLNSGWGEIGIDDR